MLITLWGQRVKILESQPPLPKKERHQKNDKKTTKKKKKKPKKKQKKKKKNTAGHSRRAQIYTNWDRNFFLMNYKLVDLHVPVSCSICLSSF